MRYQAIIRMKSPGEATTLVRRLRDRGIPVHGHQGYRVMLVGEQGKIDKYADEARKSPRVVSVSIDEYTG